MTSTITKVIDHVRLFPLPTNRYIEETISGLRDRGVLLLYCTGQLDIQPVQSVPCHKLYLALTTPRLARSQ